MTYRLPFLLYGSKTNSQSCKNTSNTWKWISDKYVFETVTMYDILFKQNYVLHKPIITNGQKQMFFLNRAHKNLPRQSIAVPMTTETTIAERVIAIIRATLIFSGCCFIVTYVVTGSSEKQQKKLYTVLMYMKRRTKCAELLAQYSIRKTGMVLNLCGKFDFS